MKRLAISIGIVAMAALLLTVGGASGKGGPDRCENPTVEGGPNADFFGTEDITDGDVVATYRGRDEVQFWATNVTVCMGGGDDRVRQGNANDTASEMSAPLVLGGRGDDDLQINNSDDDEPVVIMGESGDDRLNGNRTVDRFFGGSGFDELLGFRRKDELHGGTGEDTVLGGRGRDALFGDRQNDVLSGNRAKDTANGGPGGNDRCAAEIRRNCEDPVQ